jgi:hypothetical protein
MVQRAGHARHSRAERGPAKPGAAAVDRSIRPFHFRASDAALADLKQRLAATR